MKIKRIYPLLLCVILCMLILAGCGAKIPDTIKTGNDISMVVTTDLHYLAPALNDQGAAFQKVFANGDGRQFNYVDEIVDAFAYDVIETAPDILIISGDLTNNGEKESHKRLAEKLNSIEKAGETRVFVIPGNHDILNPWARGFKGEEQYKTDTVDKDGFRNIYEDFGYSESISEDKSTLSYLAAPSDDVWLLMLDTTQYLYTGFAPTTSGVIGKDTATWIKQCGEQAKEKNAQIVVVMHHNILDHSKVFNEGYTLDNSQEILKIFEEYNMNIVLSGHMHIQDIQSKETSKNRIYDIATSSLCIYPVQYGVLNYSASGDFDYSTAQVNVERWANVMKSKDDNLKRFREYSLQYFSKDSYDKAYGELSASGEVGEKDMVLMATTMSLLNVNYFGGTIDTAKEQVIQSEGYALWDKTEQGFFRNYVLSMVNEGGGNNTGLHISNRVGESDI